jgi:urea transport system substrate-binding protein
MVALTLTVEQVIDAPPDAVFALFGAGAGAGRVFDAACDRLAVGAVVTLRAPLGDEHVEVLGRIAALAPPHRIVIVQICRGGGGCGACSTRWGPALACA